VIGRLIDRFGVRVLLPVTMLLAGLAMVGLSTLTQEWELVAIFALIGLTGMAGGGSLVTSVPIAKWFVRRRGLAMSITTLGLSIGGVIFAPLTQVLINGYGWRNAWLILAALGVGIIIPVALIFLRRQPEDIGLLPDGVAIERRSSGSSHTPLAAHDTEVSLTLNDVIRTTAFWRLVFVFSVVMLGQSTMSVHRLPSFMDRGIDPTLVSYAVSLDAAAAAVSLFAFGFLADRFQVRYLGACGFCMVAAGIVVTLNAYAAPTMFAATLFWGLGIGGNLLLQNYIWAQYYGRHNLGAIRGFVYPITLVFGGIGAPIAGYVRDITGSYDGIWSASVVLVLLAAVALATSPPPRPHSSSVRHEPLRDSAD
jgi:sugar phosphate permease